jgi:SAM-dependent methyltransferase
MFSFWENKFREEGAAWAFEPSDSAYIALELFKSCHARHILIPGCGYGRNARLFLDAGIKVTGIEMSSSAIQIAKAHNLNYTIHHGSVTSMPFDNELYDGIFCYALIHLLSKTGRRQFLESCYNQLKTGGPMVFTVSSQESDTCGTGKLISKDRFEIEKGLTVFFYDDKSVYQEFSRYGMTSCRDFEEPVKFMKGQNPIKLKLIICRKNL